MMKNRLAWFNAVAVALIVLVPDVVLAQSGIAGVVKDTSGAVLPGVTVEAASPALIEKVRTAVSDNEGSYRIVDLRPGVYVVTFALPGFSTVKRDGIELPAAFTATVSVELTVGSVEETITVTGAAPLVDVQNTSSQRVLSREMIEALPTARSPQSYAAFTPGITTQGIGGVPDNRDELNVGSHGALGAESVYAIDGLNTANSNSMGGGGNVFRIAEAYIAEINVIVGGGTAEQAYGGTVTNVIPKEGGNSFTGSLYYEYTDSNLATSNLTDALRAQGFTPNSLSTLLRRWDISPAVGGRLLRDKLWFFSSYRSSGTRITRAGVFDNLTPLGWAYTPDQSRPAEYKQTNRSRNTRLTWQATPRNKISVFADSAPWEAWQRGYQFSMASEATAYTPYRPGSFFSASWKSPVTNQWLLDASASHVSVDWNQRRHTAETCLCSAPTMGFDVISAVEASTGVMFRSASTVGTGGTNYGHNAGQLFQYVANVSYITGSHAVKAGAQFFEGGQWRSEEPNGAVAYTLRNGLPTSITQYANPILNEEEMRANLGVYIQDQWRIRRLTLTGGFRYDYFNGGATAERLEAGLWVPARDFPATTDAPKWHDVSPRLGVAFDVFGDGKTALKGTLGRFTAAQSGGIRANNPVIRSVLSVTRTWTDGNGNFNPDCALTNFLANGECGQISNLNFGQNNPAATVFDPELLTGLRSNNWEASATVQRQLAQGVSVTGGYYRRTYANFQVNDNTLVVPADFSQYCVTAPVDARLPGGGGNQICGLYDVSPALFGRNQTVVRDAAHYGTQSQIYDGFDLTENIRLPGGATISGGLNWGRTKTSACFVVDSPGALRFCEVNPPMLMNTTFVGFYPLPWGGLVTSATYRDYPGPQITAVRTTPNSEIAPSLGRNLSNGANGTVNIDLIEPGLLYAPRPRQLDVRISKRHRFGRARLTGNLDIFNLFNSSGINTSGGGTGITLTYGPNWQRPTQLQQGRYFKVSGQVDF